MRSLACIIILLFTAHSASANSFGPETFYNRYRAATSDSERIFHLGKLAGYYYAIREDDIADSIVEKQIMMAEQTRNRDIILKVLFENPRFSLMGSPTRPVSSVTKEASGKTLDYIQRALSYARFANRDDYMALAYVNISRHYLKEGEYNMAVKFANQGFTTALNTSNDSIKVVAGLVLGATYLKIKEVVLAFKTITNAYDIADRMHNPELLSAVYHQYSLLYRQLGKSEEARDYVYRSIEQNQNNGNTAALIDDYLALGRNSDGRIETEYYLQAEQLADSIEDMGGKLEAQSHLLLVTKLGNTEEQLRYLKQHPLLERVLDKKGPHYLDWIKGEFYLYGGDLHQARRYFF